MHDHTHSTGEGGGGGGGKEGYKHTCKVGVHRQYMKGYYNSIDGVPVPSPVALRLLTAVICPLRSYLPIDIYSAADSK